MLDGLSVVECGAFVAAPFASLVLAQLGASVLKVDPVDGPLDGSRWPVAQDGTSLFWLGLNQSKRSIRVDLRGTEGISVLKRLIQRPGEGNGVLVTNLPVLRRLGGEEGLRSLRSDVIVVEIVGNFDGTSAMDYSVQPATGFPLVTGSDPGATPINSPLPAWDLLTGAYAAIAILSALRHRTTTGEGSFAQIPLSDVAFSTVSALGRLHPADRVEAPASGNVVQGAFGGDFLTRDGHRVMVLGVTDRQWSALMECVDEDGRLRAAMELAGVDHTSPIGRFQGRHVINALLKGWFASREYEAVAEGLNRCNAAWERYRSFSGLLNEDPRTDPAWNTLWCDIVYGSVGAVRVAGSPIRWKGRSRVRPRLISQGEHTADVLRDELGMPRDAVVDLAKEGVIAEQWSLG